MYTIGMVFAIVILITGAILALVGGILIGFAPSAAEDNPDALATLVTSGSVLIGIGVYLSVGQIVEIVLDNLGRKGGKGMQIANIVAGAIFSNVFTLLGGIFGLVSFEESPIVSEQ